MSEPLVMYGYSNTMLTWTQMEGMTTWNRCNSEFRRRFKAMSIAAAKAGVKLGVGTGWRVQPNPPPPGFAPPGFSNHEGFPADGVHGGAVAIDTVPESGWDWMEEHCAEYGLRTFKDVNDEPWHAQPSDIPAGRKGPNEPPWDLAVWDLPEEEDMPLTDADVKKIWAAMPVDRIARAVWAHIIDTSTAPGAEPEPARLLLDRAVLILRQYLGTFSNEAPPRVTMLERIDVNVRKLLAK